MNNLVLKFSNTIAKKITNAAAATTSLFVIHSNAIARKITTTTPLFAIHSNALSTLTNKQPPPSPHKTSLLIHQSTPSSFLSYFYMLEHDDEDSFQNHGILVNPRFVCINFPRNLDFVTFLVSSNGLFSLTEDHHCFDPVHICNPLTGEYFKLPETKVQTETVSGFGFDEVANEYKVIRMFENRSQKNKIVTQVYTLGSGEWRTINGYLPFPLPTIRAWHAFFQGAIHWLIPQSGIIMAFHFGREQFETIPLPLHDLKDDSSVHLMNLGEYLCMLDTTFDDRIEIWVMKQYGVKDSWTKEWVIVYPPNEYVTLFPVMLLKNGNILMHATPGPKPHSLACYDPPNYLACYDPVTKTFRNMDIGKSPMDWWIEVWPHPTSFVSLKDIVGQTNESMRREILEN